MSAFTDGFLPTLSNHQGALNSLAQEIHSGLNILLVILKISNVQFGSVFLKPVAYIIYSGTSKHFETSPVLV